MSNGFKILLFIVIFTGLGYALCFNVEKMRNSDEGLFGGPRVGAVIASSTSNVAGEAKIVLEKNASRQYALITNTTGTIAYLSFHATSSPNVAPIIEDYNYVIPLSASGGTYVIDETNLYYGQITASSSASVTIRTLEY